MRENAKELDSSAFKLWYIGKVKSRNGVDIIVYKYWKNDMGDVKRIQDRIIDHSSKVGSGTRYF